MSATAARPVAHFLSRVARLCRRPVRIALMSDLHLETGDWEPGSVEADLVVLAGDIHRGTAGIAWAAHRFEVPVVTVAGNHEFYGHQVDAPLQGLREAATATGTIAFLEQAARPYTFPTAGRGLSRRSVRILGTTLWSDFSINGDPGQCMTAAEQMMNDDRVIRTDSGRRLRPGDTLTWHRQQVGWLQADLGKPFRGPTVVVTHHAPSPRSNPPQSAGEILNGAFLSDLEPLIKRFQPHLWIHGHTHGDAHYRLGRTLVVSRQLGYAWERKDFGPAIVEV